jgi:putative nucleotidyltransferase with HDIG domain
MIVRDEVFRRIPEIPALPSAAAQVLRLAQDPESGVGEIMEAIEFDPALTAEVLRLANTAYFAGPRQIATLRDAGVLLGTQRILQLVLASAVLPIAKQPLKGYDLPGGQLVRHAMAMAIGSELIARLLGKPAPNHTFTAGLLADIGKIALGSFLEVDVQPVLQLALDQSMSFERAEREVLGIDHAEVGAALLDAWKVPEEVIEVVRWHHEPDRFHGDRLVVDLVHVAAFLSAGCGIGAGLDGLNYQPNASTIERLGLNHDLLERATCEMLVSLGEIERHLPGLQEGDSNVL